MQYLSNLRFGLYGSCSLLVRDVSFAALVELSAVLSSSVRSEFRQVSVRRQVKTCSRPVPAFLPCLSPSGKTQNSSAVTYTVSYTYRSPPHSHIVLLLSEIEAQLRRSLGQNNSSTIHLFFNLSFCDRCATLSLVT